MTRPQPIATDGGAALGLAQRANYGATRLAEQALLDALRTRPDRIADVAGWLHASDFADRHHGGVYATLVGVLAAGELRSTSGSSLQVDDLSGPPPAAAVHNGVALRAALTERRFTEIEYPDHRQLLTNIADAASVSTPGQHARYARMILESSVRRQLSEWAVHFDHTLTGSTTEPATASTVADVDLAVLEERIARSRSEPTALVSTTLATTPAGITGAIGAAPSPKIVHRAERHIIATALDPTSPGSDLAELLTPEDFTAEVAHGETWRAIQAVVRRGEPADVVTVAWELEKVPASTAPSGLSAESLMALGSLAQRDASRALATVTRAALAHRARHAVQSVHDLALDHSQDLFVVLAAARQVVGALDDQATRLNTTSAKDSRSTTSQALGNPDEPAARQAPPAAPQPGRLR